MEHIQVLVLFHLCYSLSYNDTASQTMGIDVNHQPSGWWLQLNACLCHLLFLYLNYCASLFSSCLQALKDLIQVPITIWLFSSLSHYLTFWSFLLFLQVIIPFEIKVYLWIKYLKFKISEKASLKHLKTPSCLFGMYEEQ